MVTYACSALKLSFAWLVGQRRGRCYARDHLDRSHHAAVLMLEDVTVVDEGADDVGIPEIHPQTHARILQHAIVVIGNVHGIAQERLVDRDARPVEQLEMKLMDVKIMQL